MRSFDWRQRASWQQERASKLLVFKLFPKPRHLRLGLKPHDLAWSVKVMTLKRPLIYDSYDMPKTVISKDINLERIDRLEEQLGRLEQKH